MLKYLQHSDMIVKMVCGNKKYSAINWGKNAEITVRSWYKDKKFRDKNTIGGLLDVHEELITFVTIVGATAFHSSCKKK